jgi:hypothetical protein
MRWVDKQGTLVHPGLLALQADIQAHQQMVAQIGAAAGEHNQAQGAIAVDALGKGLADAGIDMLRMQRDAAYAQQVQDRLRSMSPQQMIALSQRMSQPLNSDPRHQNAAKAIADDPAVVRAAATAGEAYSQAQATRLQTLEAIRLQAEQAADTLRLKPLTLPAGKPAIEWENIGCTAVCRAQWEVYAGAVLPLMIERDSAILQLRRAALQRQRAALADGLRSADGHLVASRYGAASQSAVNQTKIVAYDGAAIGDLRYLVDRITDSVRSAAAVAHCGTQIVLAPRAVCR